jgi:hypothetical protein
MPEKFGTLFAIAAVTVGFVVLAWLLFAENPNDKKKKQ